MPSAHVKNECHVERTGRVVQIEALFDVPDKESSVVEFDADLPIDKRAWSVGLIVGPSGSGKSSVARKLFDKQIVHEFEWPHDRSVIDAFPEEMSIKDITYLLGNVGFNSPPSWLRPYHVLSTGEQFRARIARALAESGSFFVIDEFTSVVDRKVAKVASHCVQKAVRKLKKQFIAVTCHYDVVDWLQPDWVFQTQDKSFSWRSLQRHPPIKLDIYPISRSLWGAFSDYHYHYLSHSLQGAAKCFGAFYDDECVAFTSYIQFPHAHVRDICMGHRLVVHPDYQGLGIGGRLDDWLGEHLHKNGKRYRNVVASPSMIAFYARSPRWRMMRERSSNLKSGPRSLKSLAKAQMKVRRMSTVSFEYVPARK